MTRVRKSTMVELVSELLEIMGSLDAEQQVEVREIITEAKAGEYHDFKNKKYPCGKVAVVAKLRATGLVPCEELAQKVIDGDYDEVADAEDRAMLRKDALEGGMPESFVTHGLGLPEEH